MIDTHAHLINEFYEDIDKLLLDLSSTMKAIINVADSYETSVEVLNNKHKLLYPSVGIHPEHACEYDDSIISKLEKLIKTNKCYAVGEIGLDYHYDNINKDKQKELFIKQINLANKYNLPVIVHSRDSIQDVFDILKTNKCSGVIHCFTGSKEMAREYIKLGYYLGIGGVLTFKNSKLYEVIKEISLDNILLETDSPFLSPEPYRGKINIPSNVSLVAKKIAEIKGITYEEVIEKTTKNAIKLFKLDRL